MIILQSLKENRYNKIYLSEQKKIEERIEKLFVKEKISSLYNPCSYIMRNKGKRLRPMLVLLSARSINPKINPYNASIAVEILHNFTLVHDDIMDNAPLRRGRETLHIKYDLSTAILSGDNLIAFAYKYLLKDCENDSRKITDTFTNGIIEICEGQSLDKEFEIRTDVTMNEYLLMIEKKTAALIKMCCSVGVQIAGGSKEKIKLLGDFGLNLGIAFQLQDDLLDIIGTEAELGKKIGGDLLEGKKTFLILKAIENAVSIEDKRTLARYLKNRSIAHGELDSFKKLFEKLNVISETKKEIEKYTNKALKSLSYLEQNKYVETFEWLSHILIGRNS